MTAATYTTNLADIFTDGTTTGWSALGGGASGLNQETDYFIQNTSCLSKNAFASAEKGMIYSYGSDIGAGLPTDGAVLFWLTHAAPNSLANKSAGGMQALIGSASSAYRQYYVGGADTMTFMGWELCAVAPQFSADNTTGSPSATVESYFGALWNLPSGGPTKGAPNAIDAIRIGRCDAVIEFGDATPNGPATFAAAITSLDSIANRYGLITQRKPGGEIECSGLILFGTSTNAVLFEDANKSMVLRAHDHVSTNFHTWEVRNASSDVTLRNITLKSLGGNSRGRWVTTDNATILIVGCTFTDMGVFGFLSNSTVNSTFRRCDAITPGGGNLSGSVIDDTNVSANSSALIYNEASDPSGELDDMTFIMGTTATHAIEFGTSSPLTMTLSGVSFEGYSASNNANDSCFHIKRTSGTVTINMNGCTSDAAGGVFSYRTDGATVVVQSSYVLTLTGVPSGVQVTIVNTATRNVLQDSESTGADVTYAHSGGETVDILFMGLDYDPNVSDIFSLTLPSSNSSIPISMLNDPNYDNP